MGDFSSLLARGRALAARHRLVASAGGLVALRIAFSGLSFLLNLILARVLGPAGLGAYSYAFAWVVLLCIPSILGSDQLMIRQVAAHLARSEWGLMHGLLRRVNVAVGVASLAMVALAALGAWMFQGRGAEGFLPALWAGLALVPLISLTRVRQSAMQGLHHVVPGSVPEQLIQPVLLLCLLAGLAAVDRRALTPPVAMLLNTAATGVAFAVGARLLYRYLPPAALAAKPVYRDLEWIRAAAPFLFLSSSGVLFAQADTLILGAMRGAQEVGTYSIAHRGADLIGFLITAQNAALASTAASLHASGEKERLQRTVTRITRLSFAASLPAAVFMIFFGRWFLSLYGPSYLPAQTALAILSVGQVANAAFGSVGILLAMTGHERDAAAAIAFGAVVNIALNLLLVPRWGAEGAAAAYAASMICWNFWMFLALRRKEGVDSTAIGLSLKGVR